MNVQQLLESSNQYKVVMEDAKKLSGKWDKSGLLEGIKSTQDRNTMAMLLENQAKQLVTETSTVGGGAGFGSFNTGNGSEWAGIGDVKLGVGVTYADINNTSVLIDIARKKGNYVPDLSFGTHFFQDLVEASIRYLPLYPDDDGVRFNEAFLMRSPNILPEILPDFARMADVVKVIDVPRATNGLVLRVLMNADLQEAVGLLAPPGTQEIPTSPRGAVGGRQQAEDHWRWRLRFAERIARCLDPTRFGVKAVYVFGSTKNATAGPGSDIDLIVHVDGTDDQREALERWLESWSLCLAEINYPRTGYPNEGLLDVHFVTDEDVREQRSYAAKIGAVTDAARPLPIGTGG